MVDAIHKRGVGIMSKERICQVGFSNVFVSVNSFKARVDYTKKDILVNVHTSDDENHDGKVILRISRQFSIKRGVISLCFIHPRDKKMSLEQALIEADNFGFSPATHHETVSSLEAADREQIWKLFSQTDSIRYSSGLFPKSSMSVACLASAVSSQTGELIPVYEIDRFGGHKPLLHLTKLVFDAPVPSAMVLPFVSKA